MSAYINVNTGAYPRHIGDIQLSHPGIAVSESNIPNEWRKVEYTSPPSGTYDPEFETAYQLPPQIVDGQYRMVWATRPLTEQEKEFRKAVELPPPPVVPDTTALDSISGGVPDVIE
jgi:hypothetical protein